MSPAPKGKQAAGESRKPKSKPGASPYEDNGEFLEDFLSHLGGLISAEVERFEAEHGVGPDPAASPLPGLVITEHEVRQALAAVPDDASRPAAGLWATLEPRVEATRAAGLILPVDALARSFSLGPAELDCLLISLASELERGYAKVFAYLNDNVTERRPSVDVIARLIGAGAGAGYLARSLFSADAPLLRLHLLALLGDSAMPLPSRGVRVADAIVDFLGGHARFDPRAQRIALRRTFSETAVSIWRSEGGAEKVGGTIDDLGPPEPGWARVLAVAGPGGSGRLHAVQTACAKRGMGLIMLDGRRIAAEPEALDLTQIALRDSILHATPVLISEAEVLAGKEHEGAPLLGALVEAIRERGWLAFLLTEDLDLIRQALPDTELNAVELSAGGQGDRERIWQELLGDDVEPGAAVWLGARFRLSPGQIATAFDRAVEGRGSDLSLEGRLDESAIRVSAPDLGGLAQRIAPAFGWDDIVVPESRLELMRDVVRRVSHREKVMIDWGFGRSSRGRGLAVLCSGPPGTGKTMAAEVMANDLGMPLFRINLATVVDKYIGETEKNLERIFGAAERTSAILFFDEADSLFGKRSEVRDAHDRYANIETGYLLQRMEDFDGVAILATNMRQNLDEAFMRRIQIVIDFPVPEAADRLRIWRKVISEQVPTAEDLDLAFLADRFELAGGSIRNIGLTAGFLAADRGARLEMSHLIAATARELEKLGRRVDPALFAPYEHSPAARSDHQELALTAEPSG